MPLFRQPPWARVAGPVTDEGAWLNRRALVKGLGLGAIGMTLPAGCDARADPVPTNFAWKLPKNIRRNLQVTVDRPITNETVAASYNNFYEFTTNKADVFRVARDFRPKPWQVKVHGEVHVERTFGLGELLRKMPLEERVYRFRCVEAWSMTVPWIGFPLSALLKQVRPLGNASHVRFVTLDAPDRFPGVASSPWYPWPYHEALTMNEAMHPLTLLAVGIYGHALPNQHGAPIRLVVPWKYGFKSIKSIAQIEVVSKQPSTFWNTLVPDEYDFSGNVRPDIDHPRWSQQSERVIPSGERIPTLMYNGYASLVAPLYSGAP